MWFDFGPFLGLLLGEFPVFAEGDTGSLGRGFGSSGECIIGTGAVGRGRGRLGEVEGGWLAGRLLVEELRCGRTSLAKLKEKKEGAHTLALLLDFFGEALVLESGSEGNANGCKALDLGFCWGSCLPSLFSFDGLSATLTAVSAVIPREEKLFGSVPAFCGRSMASFSFGRRISIKIPTYIRKFLHLTKPLPNTTTILSIPIVSDAR